MVVTYHYYVIDSSVCGDSVHGVAYRVINGIWLPILAAHCVVSRQLGYGFVNASDVPVCKGLFLLVLRFGGAVSV